MLADMATELDAARLLIAKPPGKQIRCALQHGRRHPKLFAANGTRVTHKHSIHGGNGNRDIPSNATPRRPHPEIYEGTRKSQRRHCVWLLVPSLLSYNP